MADYTPKGDYFDDGLSGAARAVIKKLQDDWAAADAAGDELGKATAHAKAEALRAGHGYSGGADGTEYIPLAGAASGGVGAVAGRAVSYAVGYADGGTAGKADDAAFEAERSAADYIDAMYNAREEAGRNALRQAYDANVLTLESARSRLPVEYAAERNMSSGDYEVEKAAFNEYAAGSGLNIGAGSQARLAMDNAQAGSLSALTRAEADKAADLRLERAKLDAKYRNDIAQAAIDGDFERARALYNDFVRA
jgi:hypothetical protein